ncbi:carbohydrate-binding protein [Lactococcus lactis]
MSGVKYVKGEYVSYKGYIYEALVDFTNFGDGNWSPDIAQSLWGFVQ